MKKIIPLLSLGVLVAAAGSAAGVVNTRQVAPSAPVLADGSTLESFCSRYWGTMTGDLCRFEQTFHFSKVHVGSEPMVTGVPVIAGDTLSVQAGDGALPLVGTRVYPLRSFVSESEGYLTFLPANGAQAFSLRQVSLRRCFSEVAASVLATPCPR
jgi:hypothetical protein